MDTFVMSCFVQDRWICQVHMEIGTYGHTYMITSIFANATSIIQVLDRQGGKSVAFMIFQSFSLIVDNRE